MLVYTPRRVCSAFWALGVSCLAYERAHFTIPKPSSEAELKEKVRTVKAIADFWGFVFQTNIDIA